MAAPDLSVVLVSYNTRDLLARALASIPPSVGGRSFETVVVDNGSTDGSVEMVGRDFPRAHLIVNDDNRGFAAANNQGIAASRGRCLLLLNSDAELIDDAAARMVAFLDEHPEAGAVGGQLLNGDGSFQASFNDFPSLWSELLLLSGLSRWLLPPSFPSYPAERSGELRRADWVGGALLMVRRAAIDAVGRLDEEYFMYAEEMDWCFRLDRGGWPVFYLPGARATHWVGRSSRRVPERRRALVYRGKWLFMRKHRGAARALLFRQLVRGASALKLAAWWLAALSTPARREHARQQISSYRFLLASL